MITGCGAAHLDAASRAAAAVLTYRGVNAMAESFLATLECELLDRNELVDARRGTGGHIRVHRRVVQHAARTLRCAISRRWHSSDAMQALWTVSMYRS